MYTKVNAKKSSSETLNSFVRVLSKNLNIPFEEFENGYNRRSSKTLLYINKKYKNYKEERYGMYYKYVNDAYKLMLCEYTEAIVELYWIEVNYKNKGIGSELINKILDTSDDLNIDVKAIPIPINGDMFDFDGKRKLNEWYKSFGFESKSKLTPALYYSPKYN